MKPFDPIEPISSDHETDSFDCGSVEQTTWLRQYALQAHRSDTARVYAACRRGTREVAGYYALSAGSVMREEASERVTKGLGRYPVPVVILTRLGVDVTEQGKGLGSALVRDALLQVASFAEYVGVRAFLIHAETGSAAAFYERINPAFERSPTDPMHLILLLKDLRRALLDAATRRRAMAEDDGESREV